MRRMARSHEVSLAASSYGGSWEAKEVERQRDLGIASERKLAGQNRASFLFHLFVII